MIRRQSARIDRVYSDALRNQMVDGPKHLKPLLFSDWVFRMRECIGKVACKLSENPATGKACEIVADRFQHAAQSLPLPFFNPFRRL
jgi:hypothetical protein